MVEKKKKKNQEKLVYFDWFVKQKGRKK